MGGNYKNKILLTILSITIIGVFGTSQEAFAGSECGFDQPTTSIKITKFHDFDLDGNQDPGEPGIPGWSFTIDDGCGEIYNVQTGQEGMVITETHYGSITVVEDLREGWVPTTSTRQDKFSPAEGLTEFKFGNKQSTGECVGYVSRTSEDVQLIDFSTLSVLNEGPSLVDNLSGIAFNSEGNLYVTTVGNDDEGHGNSKHSHLLQVNPDTLELIEDIGPITFESDGIEFLKIGDLSETGGRDIYGVNREGSNDPTRLYRISTVDATAQLVGLNSGAFIGGIATDEDLTIFGNTRDIDSNSEQLVTLSSIDGSILTSIPGDFDETETDSLDQFFDGLGICETGDIFATGADSGEITLIDPDTGELNQIGDLSGTITDVTFLLKLSEPELEFNTFTCTEEDGEDNFFENPNCWTFGEVPDIPITEHIIILGDLFLDGLTIGNGGTVQVVGTLFVDGNVFIQNGGTLQVDGEVEVTGDVYNNSADTVTVFGGLTILGMLSNGFGDTVIINPGGTVETPIVVNSGNFLIKSGGTLTSFAFVDNFFGGIFTNSGTIVTPEIVNFATFTNTGSITGLLSAFFNFAGTFDNNGLVSGPLIFNDIPGTINLGCESVLTVDEIDNDGLITSPLPVSVPIFTGNAIIIQGTCSTGGGDGDYYVGPTFGKDDLGNAKVSNGFKLFQGSDLIQQFTIEQFHTEALVEAEPNTSYTFVLETYSPLGGDAIDQVKIFTAPRTFNQNEKIWEIHVIKDITDPSGYRTIVNDPQAKLTEPITTTVQDVGSHKIVSITVGGFEITGEAEAIGLWAKDTFGFTTLAWVNDGLKISDIFTYPTLMMGFEELLSSPKVCTEQEDPDNRNSCAFEEKRRNEIAKAEEYVAQISKNNYQKQIEKYTTIIDEYEPTKTITDELVLVFGPQLENNIHLVKIN